MILRIEAALFEPPSSISAFRDATLYSAIFAKLDVVLLCNPGTRSMYWDWLKRNGASTTTTNYTLFGEPSQSSYRSVYISFQMWATYIWAYTPTGSQAQFNLGGYHSSASPLYANNSNWNHYCITREGSEVILYFNNFRRRKLIQWKHARMKLFSPTS